MLACVRGLLGVVASGFGVVAVVVMVEIVEVRVVELLLVWGFVLLLAGLGLLDSLSKIGMVWIFVAILLVFELTFYFSGVNSVIMAF